MGDLKRVRVVEGTLVMMLAVALITTPSTGYAQPTAGSSDLSSFIHNLIGEWIGD